MDPQIHQKLQSLNLANLHLSLGALDSNCPKSLRKSLYQTSLETTLSDTFLLPNISGDHPVLIHFLNSYS